LDAAPAKKRAPKRNLKLIEPALTKLSRANLDTQAMTGILNLHLPAKDQYGAKQVSDKVGRMKKMGMKTSPVSQFSLLADGTGTFIVTLVN
jgi:hypothetical protein